MTPKQGLLVCCLSILPWGSAFAERDWYRYENTYFEAFSDDSPRNVRKTLDELELFRAAVAQIANIQIPDDAPKVRVVSFADASVEFCGGVHVENTANIGSFIITKESGVSAGVRRIEAVCGNAAYRYFCEQRSLLKEVEAEVKNLDVLAGISRLKSNIAELKTELKDAQESSKVEITANEINGVAVVVEELVTGDIKEKIDELKNQNEKLCAMLFQIKGDKVLIAAGVKNADAKAGDWIKKIAPILGGGGGGRPDFAQAGGKDTTKLPEAKVEALAFITEVLS